MGQKNIIQGGEFIMLLFLIQLAALVINTVTAVFAGGAVFIGLIFMLIGLPQAASGFRTNSRELLRFLLPVIATLLVIGVFLVLMYTNVKLNGRLAISRSLPSETRQSMGQWLMLSGIAEFLWFWLCQQWLFKLLIDGIDFEHKHILIILAGAGLSVVAGATVYFA